eukprot:TRINITY_DN9482_c0_g1_i2.p1 TRINITY_DN9482_c0_g1~~TRINITY_DN9482_c0_g1_i2.p1  ORF type:complete len:495 (+),score=128.91 TRINITY_DN9482_c0_g1_i2:99-1583(+)
MEKLPPAEIRITIAPKGNMSKSKTIKVKTDTDLKGLFAVAKQKWKGKWNVCALKDGTVLSDETLKAALREDVTLVFSHAQGEVKPASIEETKLAMSEEVTKEELKQRMRFIISETLLEEDSVQQLTNCAKLKGVVLAVGLPDLHPGKGYPIGSSIITQGLIYPHLVGEDIGCGMSLVRTGIAATKQKAEKWYKQLLGIEGRAGTELEEFAAKAPFEWPKGRAVPPVEGLKDAVAARFGTVGRGNHFVEIQELFQVANEELFKQLNMDQNQIYMLIHSGSRNYGEKVYEAYTSKHGTKPADISSPEAAEYLAEHNKALAYARRSRAVIAYRILSQIENIDTSWITEGSSCVIDTCHNYIEQLQAKNQFVHRKGAAPGNAGMIIIPGSRGAYSYIVKPVEENIAISGYSLAHGAGRAMKRSKALAKGKTIYPNSNLLIKTELGSLVICENKELLYEEAPLAYKNINMVIEDLLRHKLIEVVAVMKPIVTYKYREVS